MKTITLGLTLLLSCGLGIFQNHNGSPELQLIAIHQLSKSDTLNFDFSGIVNLGEKIIAIADKPWNTFLYSISIDDKYWYADSAFTISSTERLDLEAIDYCDDKFYLANEYTGSISKIEPGSNQLSILPINFEENQLAPHTWKNAGWEGLAIDCPNQMMYIVKERQPRNIISVDMNTWTITDQFDIPQTESNDFSDTKYQNGHLYLLERNGNYITKLNLATKQVVQKYHYKHIASHPNGKLFEPEKYGMAEALLLLKDEIWIGLDNNGLEVSDHAKKTYGLSGNTPVILKFERPKGF